MIKFKLFLIRSWFRVLGWIAPNYGAKKAFLLFQTTPFKKVRDKEREFFDLVETFYVDTELEKVSCYRLGNPAGPLVILTHGWESNAGSLSGIAYELVKKGYHVVAFDLPAHGHSKLRRNNLIFSSRAMEALIRHLAPKEPFSVVAHSFGSAVTALTLSRMKITTDQLVFLTSPNFVVDVFRDYQKIVSLPENVFQKMVTLAEGILDVKVEDLVVQDRVREVNYQNLLIIHDKFDKIIPYKNALNIHEHAERSTLVTLEKAGHYRMLWNPEVISRVVEQVGSSRKKSPQAASTPV